MSADSKGYTLVEVMIGILLVAVVVTSVFSLVLTSQTTSKKSGRKAQGQYYMRQAMEQLKAYVTADSGDGIRGPQGVGTVGDPDGPWKFPGDSHPGTALDSSGEHDITSMLPAEFRALFPDDDVKLTYQVTREPAGCDPTTPGCRKKAEFQMTWDEDQFK